MIARRSGASDDTDTSAEERRRARSCAFGLVTIQAFNGAGDTATPTWINLGCYWAVQLPLAYVLAIPLGLGAQGVFAAISTTQAVLALTATYLFRRGAWKKKAI